AEVFAQLSVGQSLRDSGCDHSFHPRLGSRDSLAPPTSPERSRKPLPVFPRISACEAGRVPPVPVVHLAPKEASSITRRALPVVSVGPKHLGLVDVNAHRFAHFLSS